MMKNYNTKTISTGKHIQAITLSALTVAKSFLSFYQEVKLIKSTNTYTRRMVQNMIQY